MVYNKTAIENIIGKEFVPADYATPEAFEALLAELRAGGMENPVVLNQETWSLGGHLLGSNLYTFQDGTAEGSYKFVEDIQSGASVMDNAMFQNLFKDYDMFIEYNINKDDPLAADYDLNASYVAEGEAAFWINGTWVWPDMSTYADDSIDYGIMPIPLENEELAGKIYAFASKQIAVDKEVATEEQQAAALDFLNWLVYSEEGQDALHGGDQLPDAALSGQIIQFPTGGGQDGGGGFPAIHPLQDAPRRLPQGLPKPVLLGHLDVLPHVGGGGSDLHELQDVLSGNLRPHLPGLVQNGH